MAKKALLDVLEQTIGKYVKNLDAERLNVAVWSGKIELDSLELDIEAVNSELDQQAAEAPNLALPIKVLGGSFQSLEVDVPWASLTSRPVVLRAQGLKIQIEPFDRLAQADVLQAMVENEEQRARDLVAMRLQSLETSEKFRKQAYAMRAHLSSNIDDEKSGGEASPTATSGASSTFSSRLVRRIIENIQIEIRNVQVSLQDGGGEAGVVLESLNLATTGEDGQRVFVDRTQKNASSFLYKMLNIEGLGVYLDEGSRDSFKNTSQVLKPIGENNPEGKIPDYLSHSYVLAPLSFQAKLRQADTNACVDYAKYQLSSELSSLSVLLSRSQLDLARTISRRIQPNNRGNLNCPLFPEYRPLRRVTKETAKEWWKYAVRCVGRLNGRRCWGEFFLAYQKRQAYIPLYKRHAHHEECSWLKALNVAESAELSVLEEDRSINVQGIMAWRSIADAQVDKERQKLEEQQSAKASSTIFYSIFGSSTPSSTPGGDVDTEDPPIQLSSEELKELELLSKADFSEDNELSKDSKLYDVKFVLNAFKIDLTSYGMRQLAALDMGKVEMDFEAAQDGGYEFNFDLADVEIFDRATSNSLFPSVLRNLGKNKAISRAFHLHLSKISSGDQRLKVQLAAFETVASHTFMKELYDFFISKARLPKYTTKQNPVLAQSMSGSVDLFYDADMGESTMLPADMKSDVPLDIAGPSTILSQNVTAHDISNVLVEAWQEKLKTKASWVIDLDVHAPVVVVPEKCDDSHATVMVFNLGHLRLKYGKLEASKKVLGWLNEHPRPSLPSEASVDAGNLSINDLTFRVGSAQSWCNRGRNENGVDDNIMSTSPAVIEPIAVNLDFAVETAGCGDAPRVCVLGVIPEIRVNMSPVEGVEILSVVRSWQALLEGLQDGQADTAVIVLDDDDGECETTSVHSTTCNAPKDESPDSASPMFYFMLGLQRLCVCVSMDQGNKLEAHLVSVYASISTASDGSFVSGLKMGWFWILDRMKSALPRRQRLLAHSKLPASPYELARDDKYNILQVLEKEGVFKEDYTGSTELADISLKTPRASTQGGGIVANELDAAFSSLFIHWNPHAVKGVNGMIEEFTQIADKFSAMADNSLISAAPPTPRSQVAAANAVRGKTLVNAKMEKLCVILNSGRDDLPLFSMTVSDANFFMVTVDDEIGSSMEVTLRLGDINLTTPGKMGRTLTQYRTLLGLAPGHSESLLTVHYCTGSPTTQWLEKHGRHMRKLQALADIELSPMRVTYIHAQVMALVDYATEGVLGVIFAQAATTAVKAASEMANSIEEEKLFVIRANSFDLVLPQAPDKEPTFTIQSGSLNVDFSMLPGVGGSTAHVLLSDVSLRDALENRLQEEPIRMEIGVVIPSDELGSFDKRAMQVDVKISEARFVLSKSQYSQLLLTKDENIGEIDLCLRDSAEVSSTVAQEPTNKLQSSLTHAGVEAVQIIRRMYLKVSIETLAILLCTTDVANPLLKLAAVDADVDLRLLPDSELMTCGISLQNLVCEDRRLKAAGRQYRYLIDQSSLVGEEGDKKNGEERDLFKIDYRSGNTESTLDVNVGSPQVVLIPDAITDILSFVAVEGRESSTEQDGVSEEQQPQRSRENVRLESRSNLDIEASLVETTTAPLSMSTVSVSTKLCRIVLVDLGSQSVDASSLLTEGSRVTMHDNQTAETVVLQGIFVASLTTSADADTDETVGADFNCHGNDMEVFSAFGTMMNSPLQILEPSEGSAHGSYKTGEDGTIEVEVRAAALTPLDFTVSMHNGALLTAILNSLQECLWVEDLEDEGNDEMGSLSIQETERLENLVVKLDGMDRRRSIAYQESLGLDDGSVATGKSDTSRSGPVSSIRIKLTMPQTHVTIVNDLQGLDEALIRVSINNFVAGGEFQRKQDNEPTFDVYFNTSVVADYFDASVNMWNKLLVKPWETTFKGARAKNHRFKSKRLSTTFDLESFPCSVSFSEHFLVSLASASRMWSIYTVATDVSTLENLGKSMKGSEFDSLRSSLAARAARNLVTSLPYALENHCGTAINFSVGGKSKKRPCPNASLQYFRFEPPKGEGYGGKRTYGQDVDYEKSVVIEIDSHSFQIDHIDSELKGQVQVHEFPDGRIIFTYVAREGKTTVLHLSSSVGIVNNTFLEYRLALAEGDEFVDVGNCLSNKDKTSQTSTLSTTEGIASKKSRRFGVPIDRLVNFTQALSKGQSRLQLSITPNMGSDHSRFRGTISMAATLDLLKRSDNGKYVEKFDVVCSPEGQNREVTPFVIQVLVKMTLVNSSHVYTEIGLEPRAVFENLMPIALQVRTPMPHTFSTAKSEETDASEVTYTLDTHEKVEIFTAGPSIALTMQAANKPVAGSTIEWLDGGWINLPLVPEFSLPEALRCTFPFSKQLQSPTPSAARGMDVFVAEGREALNDLANAEDAKPKNTASSDSIETMLSPRADAPLRTFYVTVCQYGVDHTGGILFEQATLKKRNGRPSMGGDSSLSLSVRSQTPEPTSPFSAFASTAYHRISPLPIGTVPLRILQMTMERDTGIKRSMPFFAEELVVGGGGADSTAIVWEDRSPTGLYAYRKLLNEHQSEIHVVPEFSVFNGSKEVVVVQERGKPEVIIEAGKMSPLRVDPRDDGLEIALIFVEMDCRTSFINVGKLGPKMAIVKSSHGVTIGSVFLLTAIDSHGEARLVVKIGDVKTGDAVAVSTSKEGHIFRDDFFRVRVRWTELQLLLNEVRPRKSAWGFSNSWQSQPKLKNRDTKQTEASATRMGDNNLQPVASVAFSRFTFDVQRVFKDTDTGKSTDNLSERSQISLIIHNIVVKDLTPQTKYPIVLESSSDISFVDLCIRTRGPLDADLIQVDLFDLNFAHANGRSERISLTTSELYMWRLIDLTNRIMEASGDFAGVKLVLNEDTEHGGFIVEVENSKGPKDPSELTYSTPESDKLFNINLARVSPFSLMLSFQRSPDSNRYKKSAGGGAPLVNYFARRLKFTIERAELKFARYEESSLKGPPDRLLESLATVYTSRMKFKMLTILSASSLKDWKFLAARDTGDDEFVEGDILRVTGNMAGKGANLVFKRFGQGLGTGVSNLSRKVGDSIESTSDKIGARKVGAGVNSIVSGLGDGVGTAVTGVGSGAGKILKGAGAGIGQVFGGVTGGVLQVGRGVGKGISHGDGRAVVEGISRGANSMGGGLAQGAESAVMGAADGVVSAGRGLFSGVKSVGKGLGGAFKGKKPPRRQPDH